MNDQKRTRHGYIKITGAPKVIRYNFIMIPLLEFDGGQTEKLSAKFILE